jgi:MtN3 and saliva related transmembrane protein
MEAQTMGQIFNLVGFLAAALTSFGLVPQAVKAHRTKHTKDLSLEMFTITAAGLVLWIIYGLYIRSAQVVVANILTLMLCSYIIYMKVKYG